MKKISILMLISLTALVLTACSKDEPAPQAVAEKAPAVEPTQPTPAPEPTQPAAPSGISGSVVETMNAAGYTYVLVDDGKEKVWAAAPQFSVSVGDQVMVPEGMAMHNYHSQTLDRDFDVVYFVESVLNASNPAAAAPAAAAMQMPEGHPSIKSETPSAVDLTNIAKADGGMTVAEIYGGKADLSGKDVTLRGKVVKFSPQIMGTNWIHIQDGSGDQADGSNDLTVTSSIQVKVGDTVVATGPLTLDKDFGYGYKYDLIMENAAITIE